VSPEAGRKQRRRGHPDAELIAVLEKANRPKSDVAFRSQPAIGLEAVDMRIKLRAGDKLDQADRHIEEPAVTNAFAASRREASSQKYRRPSK